MNIALFTGDRIDFPCPQIRIVEPSRVLGMEMRVADGLLMIEKRRRFDDVDLLLVQRGFPLPRMRPLCEALLSCGIPVVYETDDHLQRRPQPHNRPDSDDELAGNIEWFAGKADLVTVSTQFLADIYREFANNVMVLPNFLGPRLWNDDLLRPPAPDRSRICLGLVGSRYHDKDFAMVEPLLHETLLRYPQVDCVFYGALPDGVRTSERIRFVPGDYVYEHHPRRLADLRIDIALVPLNPSLFNRAKSNIKFLEFGFLGIPGLYADLEPYRDSVTHGENGFLCGKKPAAWRESLFSLIEDETLRFRMGQRARQTVLAHYMLPQNAHRWVHCYEQAIDARKARSKPAAQ